MGQLVLTIISGNDDIGICELKTYLMHTFAMKDLGQLTYFLGLEFDVPRMGSMFMKGSMLKM